MFGTLHGPAVYLTIMAAAVVEGEVTYVAASAIVAAGQLDPLAVIIAGALGAALGDQFYFYLLRGRIARWVGRFPALTNRAGPLVARVRRHDVLMVLLIRFAPGLRVALAAACAWAEVPPLKFSVLNGVTAFVWAVVVMALVAWIGPASLAAVGLTGWKAAVLAGLVIVACFHLAGRLERRALAGDPVR